MAVIDPTVIRTRRVTPRLRCARCDQLLGDPSKRLFSTWTKHHYCIDVDGCKRRTARRKKKS